MPKRTRIRLSQKPSKHQKNDNEFDEDQEPPTEAEWALMTTYGSFVINDADGEEYTFTKGDHVIIVPSGCDPQSDSELCEYWVAKIKDIRATVHDEGSNNVWARVQWFYSGKDVSDVMKSFDRNIVGRYERVLSDHYDFVAPAAFNGIITVARFCEDDHEQTYIPPRNFYRRYTFEYKARRLQPNPRSRTCVCSVPYAPEEIDPSKLMHFCPRPSCRMAYHEKCLLNIKSSHDSVPVAGPSTPRPFTQVARKHTESTIYVKRREVNGDTNTPKTTMARSRALGLLACSPDTNDKIDLESLLPVSTVQDNAQLGPPKKKRRGRHPKTIPSSPTEVELQQRRALTQVLSTLPPDLLNIAQQPMVRGGAFRFGGVAGNIGAVTRARRMVYRLLKGGDLPDDWEEEVLGEDADIDNAIVKLTGGRIVAALLCPTCNSAI